MSVPEIHFENRSVSAPVFLNVDEALEFGGNQYLITKTHSGLKVPAFLVLGTASCCSYVFEVRYN